ncbi:unnamed protein product [Caenorhabditis sp. 36 PRJEB53466]|nr:unnamed protein product [Caenorhabditis sp. 36 PRJEB53466]
MTYQLICTLISVLLNSILIHLIWSKSPAQTGNYRYLMVFTACFEIFWGAFDLPAAIIAHSVRCAFIVFRIDYMDSWFSPAFSSFMILVYTAIFGASMAIFAAHFLYRYGSIDCSFGKRFVYGAKFWLLFVIPLVYSLWWGSVVRLWFWKNPDMDEYTKDLIMEKVGLEMRNISYIGAKFYDTLADGTQHLNRDAWLGVVQMLFMVISSMSCVFGFGTMCYIRLSDQLSIVSAAANNLQKQLFYALVLQTAIPLVLMHIPITVYFLCPMLDLDFDFASEFVASTITLYPAVDPLPNFFIIKSYRDSLIDIFRSFRVWRPKISAITPLSSSGIGTSENGAARAAIDYGGDRVHVI